VADPLVAAVESARVPREETPHTPRERAIPGADQEMGVVREEGPGVDGEGALRRQAGQAGDEVVAVRVVSEDRAALQAPHHDMVEDSRGIKTRLTRHGKRRV